MNGNRGLELMTREDDLPISGSGQIRIPKPARDEAGLRDGDYVNLAIIADGERKHFSTRLTGKGRVTVPARLRRKFGIEDGGNIDLEVYK